MDLSTATPTLIYSRNAIPVDPEFDKSALGNRSNIVPPDLPLPPEAFGKLFGKEPYAHFFIKIDGELMEIRGATVHGSKDLRGKSQQGFFFVGRLWNEKPLEEMSLFSSTKLTLISAAQPPRKSWKMA